MTNNNYVKMAQECEKLLDLGSQDMSWEYKYKALPLCIMDAIFSISARYSSTINTVEKICYIL